MVKLKIVVINGTEVKGCTYHIKEQFLSGLRDGNDIIEFYLPKDLPHFCCGCKACFLKNEKLCPHAEFTIPIWEAFLKADLIVFAYPVYALRTTAQTKALLDHFCVHWTVHRPDKRMFSKHAVILTNSVGAPNGSAQKDVRTSLSWMGVSDVRCLGFGLMGEIFWNEMSDKRREDIINKTGKLAAKCKNLKPTKMGLKVKALFEMSRIMHKNIHKAEKETSADNRHWINNGWMKE